MRSPSILSRPNRRGFTLIEMMAVILIIALALGLGAFSVKNMMSSVDLNTSATAISDTLNLARQIAMSSNRPVEMRFYKVPPKGGSVSTPASGFVYRAIALYLIGDSGPEPIGKLVYLNGDVQAAATEILGPLLFYTPTAQSHLRSIDPSDSLSFDYRYFLFRSDGSTNLENQTPGADTWHCMLFNSKNPPSGDKPPSNYTTLQVDPANGHTETFQP